MSRSWALISFTLPCATRNGMGDAGKSLRSVMAPKVLKSWLGGLFFFLGNVPPAKFSNPPPAPVRASHEVLPFWAEEIVDALGEDNAKQRTHEHRTPIGVARSIQ